MVTSIITCGPFQPRKLDEGAEVNFVVKTRGDWVKHPEGHERIESAAEGIQDAVQRKLLPDDMELNFKSDDEFEVTVPCKTMEAAMRMADKLKEAIPFITNAVEAPSERKIGQ